MVSSVPPVALPLIRPLKAFRYFVRFGCNITVVPQTGWREPGSARRPLSCRLGVLRPLVLGHRVVRQDLALEDPDLHAAGAVGRLRRRLAVVDVRSEERRVGKGWDSTCRSGGCASL